MKKTSVSLPKYLIIALLFPLLFAVFMLGMQYQKKNITKSYVLEPNNPTNQTIDAGYKTRYFNTLDKFSDKQPYPAELTSVQEAALVPMKCTDLYTGEGGIYTFYDEKIQKTYPLTDPTLLSYIKMLSKRYQSKTINEIVACTPKQGKSIILYSLGPCGGGCSGIPYVGIVNDSEIREVGMIEEDIAYFGCRQALQMTNDNFYFECGGGDGSQSSASIYRLSISKSSISKLE